MALFKKKEDIPEIPEPPAAPNFGNLTQSDNLEKEAHHLPEFQGDGRGEVSRETIKYAVDEDMPESPVSLGMKAKKVEEPMLPSLPSVKQEKPEPFRASKDSIPEIKESFEEPKKTRSVKGLNDPIVKKDANESIFVRIDKFNLAKKDVHQISRSITEIEKVLDKLTETKMKEDEEVAEIEHLMEEIRMKMDRIDSDVFNRI